MVEVNRLVAEHPSIDKLVFQNYIFKVDDAITLIRNLNSLKHFTFTIKDMSEFDRLLKQLGNEWRAQHGYGTVYKLTR